LAIAPKLPGNFRAPFTTSEAWGAFEIVEQTVKLHVRHGSLSIQTLDIPLKGSVKVSISEREIPQEKNGTVLKLSRPIVLHAGQTLVIHELGP
jgi:hypothetical protein